MKSCPTYIRGNFSSPTAIPNQNNTLKIISIIAHWWQLNITVTFIFILNLQKIKLWEKKIFKE